MNPKQQALVRLAIARQFDLDEGTQEVYLDSLRIETDIDVDEACHALATKPRADYDTAFPSLGALLAMCREVRLARAQRRIAELASHAPKQLTSGGDEPTYHCRDCWDEPSGWVVCLCTGRGKLINPSYTSARVTRRVSCLRTQDHPAHTYTERCPCAPSNPVIARHRDRMVQASQKRAERHAE